ncbi:MAG TPA: oligosaccharide flippase family protein [Geminicoccaceae bacterium]|nr:oligosaccharide flippase family protein [Geminicoccaceae bacterium]
MIARVKGLLRFRLVRNVVALYGVRAVDQLLPIVVIPFLARVLGAEGWGLVASVQALAIYGIVTVEYGFELAGTRAVARDRGDSARLAELISGIFATQLLFAGVIVLATFLVRLAVPELQDQPALLWAALVFAVLQGLHPLWFFVGQERIPLIASIGVAAKVLATIVIFTSVRAPEDGWIVLAAYAGAAGLTTAAGYALVLRQVRPGRLNLKLVARTVKLGFSMFLMRIAVLMHTAGNSFLLLLLAGPVPVAFFAAGEKLCRPAAWLLHPINVALLPRLSHLAEHSPDQAKALASLSILLMAAVGIAFGLAIGLLAPWLVDLLFGLPEYQPAVTVLRIVALIIPVIVLNAALVSQWLIPHGLDRGLLAVILSATVINLLLALLLVPRSGALGMAWVTVFVEVYILIGLLWVLRRRGLSPIEPKLLPTLWRDVGALAARRS